MVQRSLLLALAPAVLLAGCGGTRNRGLESVHQPVVSRTEYAIDLDASHGPLAPGEAARLDGWLGTMRLGYGDQVAVDGGSDAAAADVGGIVARYGLLLADRPPVTPAPIAEGTVRVVVSRMRAAVPGCPDWSRNITNDFGGHTHSNYGCAVNANLAAMIANPADLVRGTEDGAAIDPASAAKAIDTYRKATPTGAGALPAVSAGGKK